LEVKSKSWCLVGNIDSISVIFILLLFLDRYFLLITTSGCFSAEFRLQPCRPIVCNSDVSAPSENNCLWQF